MELATTACLLSVFLGPGPEEAGAGGATASAWLERMPGGADAALGAADVDDEAPPDPEGPD